MSELVREQSGAWRIMMSSLQTEKSQFLKGYQRDLSIPSDRQTFRDRPFLRQFRC
jgi:hypothetical protein